MSGKIEESLSEVKDAINGGNLRIWELHPSDPFEIRSTAMGTSLSSGHARPRPS